MPTFLNGLFEIPDPRPSKAHPEHRAARKALEKEHPHFDIKELGLKAGVLMLLAGVALFPRIKAEAEMLEGKVHDKGREKMHEWKDDLEGKDHKKDCGDDGRRRSSHSSSKRHESERRKSVGYDRDGYDRDLLYDRRRMVDGRDGRRSTGWDRDGEVYVGRNWGRGWQEGSDGERRSGEKRRSR
jgi:hypothetical protein